jgi:hypothetical protein
VRRPFPPGGRAKVIFDWQDGMSNFGTINFGHDLSSMQAVDGTIIYFREIPSQEKIKTGYYEIQTRPLGVKTGQYRDLEWGRPWIGPAKST